MSGTGLLRRVHVRPRERDQSARAPRLERPRPATRPSEPRLHQRRHVGLRARITITFALGAAILSGTIAAITYFSVRSSIVTQQTTSLYHEAVASAEVLRPELQLPVAAWPHLLEGASAGAREAILFRKHNWYATSPFPAPPAPLSKALRTTVLSGTPASETILVRSHPTYVVGVPIPAANSAYFALFSMSEVAGTLHVLLASLLLAAVVVTLAGALLGSWAANRALRPLHEAAEAALDIASGHLDTRLETDDYADLAVLTSAFNSMADRLQDRIEREVSFTSDVNHELRSPLTTLAASLSVLEGRAEELPERSQRALALLGAEVRRFRRLVDELLEISRIDAGLSDVSMAEVPLGDLVRRSVSAGFGSVPVEFVGESAERYVSVDKRRFERILANLLQNADNYAGGATRVRVETAGRLARVAVEDEGPGIPLEERQRIFDRFSRGASGRRRGLGEGTGLGLAIATEHARILGGRVYVEENEPRGARFVVEIPLLKEAAQ